MQYRKNRFSQTLPEQRPRWTSSKNISFRSFRFLFIFFFWNFFWILRSQRPKLTSKSGIFQKLPFKKWKCCRKDQPRTSKDLISSAYCRWKIWKRVELEFLTNFFKFMLRDRGHQLWVWTEFKAQKTTLVQGFTQRDYTLGKNNHFNYSSGKSNGEFWQYFQIRRSLEQYEKTLWPLMSLRKSTHGCF